MRHLLVAEAWPRQDALPAVVGRVAPAAGTIRPGRRGAAGRFPAPALLVEMARYLAVGGVAFAADFCTLVLLAEVAHLHYLSSAAVAFCCGLLTNYVLSVSWVFRARAVADRRAEFAIFCAIGIIGLAGNEGLLFLGTGALGLDYRLSKLGAVALVLAWNFGLRKVLLFRPTAC